MWGVHILIYNQAHGIKTQLCHYSRPIMAYLVSKYARNDSLYPKDPKRRAIVDQMMYFDAGSLFTNLVKCYVRIDLCSENVLINIMVESAMSNDHRIYLMKWIFFGQFPFSCINLPYITPV